MIKTSISFTLFFLFFVIYGLYLSQYEPLVIREGSNSEHGLEYFDYRGVLNIHSSSSIGSESALRIASAAKEVGLDFILLTDLNDFGDSKTQIESYFDRTLVLNGGKYSYLDSRLNFFSTKPTRLGAALGEAQIYFSDYLSQKKSESSKSLVWLAHPFHAGFDWNGEIPPGMDGIEILNLKSLANQALNRSKFSVLWSLLIYPFNPKLALVRLFNEPSEALNLFDSTSQRRRFAAFAGAEASARAIPFADYLVKFPSYQRLLSAMTTHVLLKSELTGHLDSDKDKLFQALKRGHSYLSFDLIGNPKGFLAVIKEPGREGGRSFIFGDELKFKKGLKMEVELPGEPTSFYEIALYRNGLRVETANQPKALFDIKEPGVYRVQVRVSPQLPLPDAKRWLTWIYTNNFYVN